MLATKAATKGKMVVAKLLKILEARVGIEPTHKGFADLSLTTWVPRLGQEILVQAVFESQSGDARVGGIGSVLTGAGDGT
jgi:hypothetical protein